VGNHVEVVGWQPSLAEPSEVAETAPPYTTEELFRRHVGDVCRIVSRLLGPQASEADVDDVVQQVFIAADRALPRFRGDSKVTTWLYGISTRVVLHNLRGRRRYRAMIDRFEASIAEAPAPRDPEEALADRDAVRQVWGALLHVAPKKRVVFVLYEIEGMTAREIAEALEISEASVRTRLRRARGELVRRLKKKGVS
jgi:RNA polymerase sigma-70 factor (ECF subfamily)